MTCEVIRQGRVAMAEAGWKDEEITALELELEVAKRRAEAASFARNETAKEQKRAMQDAEEGVIKVAHDRHHRELGDMAREIEKMTAWKKAHPNEHYNHHSTKVPAGKKEDA